MPMVALHWEKYFQHILEKYNGIYKVQMPKVTPHVCRHKTTFEITIVVDSILRKMKINHKRPDEKVLKICA